MKIYSAYSIVPKYGMWKDVRLEWLCSHRCSPLLPYEGAIEGEMEIADQTSRLVPQDALNERFTAAEVDELRSYLRQRHDVDLVVEEVALPLPDDLMPYGMIGCGGGRTCYPLHQEDGYDLSIRIEGYGDLRRCQRLDDQPPAANPGEHHVSVLKAFTLECCLCGDKTQGSDIMAWLATHSVTHLQDNDSVQLVFRTADCPA